MKHLSIKARVTLWYTTFMLIFMAVSVFCLLNIFSPTTPAISIIAAATTYIQPICLLLFFLSFVFGQFQTDNADNQQGNEKALCKRKFYIENQRVHQRRANSSNCRKNRINCTCLNTFAGFFQKIEISDDN